MSPEGMSYLLSKPKFVSDLIVMLGCTQHTLFLIKFASGLTPLYWAALNILNSILAISLYVLIYVWMHFFTKMLAPSSLCLSAVYFPYSFYQALKPCNCSSTALQLRKGLIQNWNWCYIYFCMLYLVLCYTQLRAVAMTTLSRFTCVYLPFNCAGGWIPFILLYGFKMLMNSNTLFIEAEFTIVLFAKVAAGNVGLTEALASLF